MTTDGFFSAVENRDNKDEVVVRTRVREDAERLAQAVKGTVLETPKADYRFRVSVPKSDWAAYVEKVSLAIDYDNFKNAVYDRQGHIRAHIYGDVWAMLYELQQLQDPVV